MLVNPRERLLYIIRMVSGALTQEMERALRPVQLTQVQLGVLVLSGLDGPQTAAELARRCGVTAQSMATAVKQLEDRGLVARRPAMDRGRALLIDVTDTGRDLAVEAQRLVEGVNAKALALLQPGDADELHRLLTALATGLGYPAGR